MLEKSEDQFVSHNMSIDIDDLYRTIDKFEVGLYKNCIIQLIKFGINQVEEQLATSWKPDILGGNDSPAELAINDYYFRHFEDIENLLVREVADSIRHAFCSYAYGGLHQLFTRQENEVWYPKVILSHELKPNDIESLPDELTIYRGTEQSEFDSQSFGQSWTTKLTVAEDFAFRHYDQQPWFTPCNRVVLKAAYAKNELYYSNQSCEFEVVVNTSKLQAVQRVSSHNKLLKSDG